MFLTHYKASSLDMPPAVAKALHPPLDVKGLGEEVLQHVEGGDLWVDGKLLILRLDEAIALL